MSYQFSELLPPDVLNMKPMIMFIWVALGFLLGELPFSVWLVRLILHTDIRRYGDGNPGPANAWRAGGPLVGIPAAALDYLKGAIPVYLAHFTFGVSGWGLTAVALAPLFGHAFSPFLGFRGGKAVTTTFGIWTGLTLWEGPTLLGTLLGLFFFLQKIDAWAAILGMLGLLVYLLVRQPDDFILTIWAGNMLILTWKYRSELRCLPRLRPWLSNCLKRRR